MSKPPPSIAATSTLAMLRTAESRGIETADLLVAVGLTRESLEDPDSRIPGPTVLGIWNALRERTADPALQLAAPTSLPFGAYRIIDYLVGASATVGEGISRFARFFSLIADAVVLSVNGTDDEHCLSLGTASGGPIAPVYVDYVFAALVSRIRMRIRSNLEVRRVELRQSEPRASAVYGEVFRAPVRFGAGADRLCFSGEEWDSPMESADATLARLLEEHARILARRIPHAAAGFRAEVQKTIAAAPLERGSAEDVARALHVSVRTLQRKLVATGTTFREVSDTVRGQLAEEYLTDPGVSIAEVAFLLGFSDQSSFNRAFRRWTGESPGRWRRRRVPTGTRSQARSAGDVD
ncbi:MAG TPA: AraC family transcriptional regulator [Longimicrobiales bacterium]